jgi:hypothetical protein
MFKKLANGCTSDLAYLYLHMMIASMQPGDFESGVAACGSAMARSTFEKSFQTKYVFTIFADKEQAKTEAKLADIRKRAESGTQELALGAELNEAVPKVPAGFSQLLRFRQEITTERFKFKFDTTVAQDYPTLNSFLCFNHDLKMAGDLYALLHMSHLVYRRYAGTLTRVSAENVSFMDAIEAVPAEREEWAEAFELFRRAYNKWAPEVKAFQCHPLGVPSKENPNLWMGMPYLKANDGGVTHTAQGSYTTNEEDGWATAAQAKSIKLAVINAFEEGAPAAYDPDSCMLKLLLEKMIESHNERLIQPARELLDPDGALHRNEVLPLGLVREVDMIKFTMHDFEATVRGNSTQSLKYGQGGHVTYDYAGIQDWIHEHVVGNVPLLQPLMDEFPWVGEGSTNMDFIGGIKQEGLPEEIAGAVSSKDLTALSAIQVALDRLDESIGFMDILGASDPNMLFDTYCREALRLNDEELLDFGGPSSALRTAVQLKHLSSLRGLLKDALTADSFLEKISPLYGEELSQAQQDRLTDFCQIAGSEAVGLATEAMAKCLKTQFKDFAEPMALSNEYTGPTVIGSGGNMAGALDFQDLPGSDSGETLCDMDWWNDSFPDDIPIANLKETYVFLLKQNLL